MHVTVAPLAVSVTVSAAPIGAALLAHAPVGIVLSQVASPYWTLPDGGGVVGGGAGAVTGGLVGVGGEDVGRDVGVTDVPCSRDDARVATVLDATFRETDATRAVPAGTATDKGIDEDDVTGTVVGGIGKGDRRSRERLALPNELRAFAALTTTFTAVGWAGVR